METTVIIDDELYAKALELAGPAIDSTKLIQEIGNTTFVINSK